MHKCVMIPICQLGMLAGQLVLLFDGNSEHEAHALKKKCFHTCASISELPSNVSTMKLTEFSINSLLLLSNVRNHVFVLSEMNLVRIFSNSRLLSTSRKTLLFRMISVRKARVGSSASSKQRRIQGGGGDKRQSVP